MASRVSSVLPTRRISPRCSRCDELRAEGKQRREVHLIFAVVLTICAILILTYFIIFVYKPNRDFINKKKETCVIISANLACWRHSIFSSSLVEKGRFTCWHFMVQHSNATTVVQYDKLEDFPLERNGCTTEESCGMEVWPCRIGDNSSVIALRWTFPFSEALYCFIGFVAVFTFGMMAGWRFLHDTKAKGDDEDAVRPFDSMPSGTTGQQSHDSSVPFSFRRRMPTWMQHQSSLKTGSSVSPIRTISSPTA